MDSQGKTVLIIEDDVSLAKVLQTKLSSLGYNAFVASDGEKAVEFLESAVPNVILLDIMLPKKNGLEVLQWMKTQPKLKDVPVIVVSNLGNEKDIQSATEFGAKEYLVKANVPLSQIVDRIKSYLE